VGNPDNNASIKELAQIIVDVMREIPRYALHAEKVRFQWVPGEEYYRNGYDDVFDRMPSIAKMRKLMNWTPKVSLRETVKRTLEALNPDR
jgi:nucleoside-diphosphate-sugar epimerase